MQSGNLFEITANATKMVISCWVFITKRFCNARKGLFNHYAKMHFR